MTDVHVFPHLSGDLTIGHVHLQTAVLNLLKGANEKNLFLAAWFVIRESNNVSPFVDWFIQNIGSALARECMAIVPYPPRYTLVYHNHSERVSIYIYVCVFITLI